MADSNQTLFGFPVVIIDAVPVGEIIFGPLPTWQDVLTHGSLEAAIEAQKERWGKIKNIETDNE